MSQKYFKDAKSDVNKQHLEIKLRSTCWAESPLKTIRNLIKVFSIYVPNFVVLAWMGDELSRGQALNGVHFDFQVEYHPPPKKKKNKKQKQ